MCDWPAGPSPHTEIEAPSYDILRRGGVSYERIVLGSRSKTVAPYLYLIGESPNYDITRFNDDVM